MDGFYHQPVLLQAVVEALVIRPGTVIVDGTLGGGGHSEAILRSNDSVRVVGLDQDDDALEAAARRLIEFQDRIMIKKTNYQDAKTVLGQMGLDTVDGVLLDLGVSSHQLDTGERGFSFNRDGALDMRMNRSCGMTAAHVVNTYTEFELEKIFREYGEEHQARKIAREIVRRREDKPFSSTLDLAGFIEKICGGRHGKIHPATKVFQALRIEVNNELGALQNGLEGFSGLLAKGGRFAVITFHSLEDRIVKHYFRDCSQEMIDHPTWASARKNPRHLFRLVTRKPVEATDDEIRANPRARSAKLRIVEKI